MNITSEFNHDMNIIMNKHKNNEDIFDLVSKTVDKYSELMDLDKNYAWNNIIELGILTTIHGEDITPIEFDLPYLYYIYSDLLYAIDKKEEALFYINEALKVEAFNIDYLVYYFHIAIDTLDRDQFKYEVLDKFYVAGYDNVRLALYYKVCGDFFLHYQSSKTALAFYQYSKRLHDIDVIDEAIDNTLKNHKLHLLSNREIIHTAFYLDGFWSNCHPAVIDAYYLARNTLMHDNYYQEALNIFLELRDILGDDPSDLKTYNRHLEQIITEAKENGVQVFNPRSYNRNKIIEDHLSDTKLITTVIAGTSYIKDISKYHLSVGEQIILTREKDNNYDDLAIRVNDLLNNKLGYIPKKDNRILASLLDGGYNLYGLIDEVTAKSTNYYKISISIYLQREETIQTEIVN